MSDGDTLLTLVKRCEEAKGPDRDIDHAINDWMHVSGVTCAVRYTLSFENAMMVVPPGWKWSISTSNFHSYAEKLTYCAELTHPGGKGYIIATAATPALALCAASFRARSCFNLA